MLDLLKRLAVSALLLGCDGHLHYEPTVPPQCASQYTAAVVACTQAGNPLSDEEGEDLVRQCQDAASDSWAAQRPIIWENDYGEQPCDSRCAEPMKLFTERTAQLIAMCERERHD